MDFLLKMIYILCIMPLAEFEYGWGFEDKRKRKLWRMSRWPSVYLTPVSVD